MIEEESYKCISVQKEYCKEKHLPYFAPSDGICYRCKKNIYKKYPVIGTDRFTGIEINQAKSSLITGCPHCHYSFVE